MATSEVNIPTTAYSRYEKRGIVEEGGITERHVFKGGEASYKVGQAGTFEIIYNLGYEWPEVIEVYMELIRESLSERSMQVLKELSETTGWNISDVIDDIKNLDIDPLSRADKYRKLHENYYREALEYKKKGNRRQAGEKLWGSILALIKLYASLKGMFVTHWSLGKINNIITSSVEQKYRKLFRDLVDKGFILHEHFYEGELDELSFDERWEELLELLEKARNIVYQTI